MTVSFATDIFPLFTKGDIDCMVRWDLNLADYEQVKEKSQKIFDHLNGIGELMPPGGWPRNKIALFESWIKGGHQP